MEIELAQVHRVMPSEHDATGLPAVDIGWEPWRFVLCESQDSQLQLLLTDLGVAASFAVDTLVRRVLFELATSPAGLRGTADASPPA